jgi:hypothetical protein
VSLHPDAPPFEGWAAAVATCTAAAECAAERWRKEPLTSAVERTLVRDGDRIVWLDDQTVWPARWRQISGALSHCLGDPLAIPPAADPGGGRDLLEDPATNDARWSWQVRLSGNNRCNLSGTILLSATGPKVDVRDLRVGKQAWHAGGRHEAEAFLRAELRELARTGWDTLNEAERVDLLRALRTDPEASAWVDAHDRRVVVSAP